ncbi:lysyl-tRNA synthetase, class II [Bathymodiolus platifrons methanotrophic gill symbiont]|uniref:lysine--tRNA ligase n=1 Tax=Bathymodiolus platifrons methanotrophic gill symbiont TaxID=113268 RepID=UPI000B4101AC|nr:lysine--tRNA ligase [Bathymodiolus platifrons methanotrophic gill symbiont]MCK5869538.1 lysine--tRNA ligase [Methyloprofundus sp.]TXL01591.1 lysine--tRNA ligase [Methylococcaceae bacterium HT1]TXL15219.1 lysine--tRNA ligase [Methylococcaceae bacterium HT4]TXL18707.1 lysine--tRNA ligase [Methylococcaceae bacterium HT3]TXL20516.1 lysine--tRNA ligase [Methylococcaceae bacterium HT5]TXL23849.1 lysine--tRNA ligase [Methylococcaceae bacterium HT2]
MAEIEHDEQEQITQRRSKLKALRENGGIAFPTDFRRNVVAGELIAEYNSKTKEELEAEPVRVKLAGRLMTRRIMGKASFAHIQDMSGKIQLYVTRDTLAEGFYNEQFKKWDIGDILGVEGVLFKTKVGELSVKVDDIRLLTKSLRPLPEKFHGIADQEIKYRQRYLDLIMSEQSRNTFLMRSKIVAYIRQFLIERKFLEVETPMMQTIPGGATARPFETFHNALDIGMYLRIAPELYLKRLVVGGFERVFEINRNFRNEGLSTRHNPEFTMLEFYQAYAEYGELMDLTEAMLKGLAEDVVGNAVVCYQGENYDFGKPFERMTVFDSILHFNPDLKPADIDNREAAVKVADNLGIPVKEGYGLGKVQIEIFEKTVESRLMNPTFITAYPVEVSPLARRNDENPHVTDRFEFFVGGREIANGFTELNDSEDQAERFMQQVQEKEAGDDEAMHFDADYITALEHGMPPTAGEGIGIDRLVMLFTDAPSIRDVLLFPHMRPKKP